MRRFYSSALASAILVAGANPIKADTTYVFRDSDSLNTLEIFRATTNTDGTSVDLTKITTLGNEAYTQSVDNSFWHDTSQNKLFILDNNYEKIYAYDIESNTAKDLASNF